MGCRLRAAHDSAWLGLREEAAWDVCWLAEDLTDTDFTGTGGSHKENSSGMD